MACAQPAAKWARRDWTLSDKIWLLDYKKQNPKTNALELGQDLAEHLSKIGAGSKLLSSLLAIS
jgi:hypothetical protein